MHAFSGGIYGGMYAVLLLLYTSMTYLLMMRNMILPGTSCTNHTFPVSNVPSRKAEMWVLGVAMYALRFGGQSSFKKEITFAKHLPAHMAANDDNNQQ